MTTLLQDKPTTTHGNRSTAAENTATIKQWIASMVKGDLDKAPYAEDAETSDPSGKFKGKKQIVDSFKVWKTAFPQATGEVTNQIAMGDHVTSEVIYRTTHTGPFVSPTGTIQATNKPVVLKTVLNTTFRNGLIQRERTYFDQTDLMTQLGVTPQPKP
jgi:ketosteroid isomerase-like protein